MTTIDGTTMMAMHLVRASLCLSMAPHWNHRHHHPLPLWVTSSPCYGSLSQLYVKALFRSRVYVVSRVIFACIILHLRGRTQSVVALCI